LKKLISELSFFRRITVIKLRTFFFVPEASPKKMKTGNFFVIIKKKNKEAKKGFD